VRGQVAVVAPPAVALVVLLVVAEVVVRLLEVPAFLVPPPSAVFATVMAERAALLAAMKTTAIAAVAGLGLSMGIGSLVGAVLASSRLVERAFYPYAVFLQTVPIVAIAPLLVLWFGPGTRAAAVSAFVVSVFPVIAGTLAGFRSVEPSLRDLFRLYRAGRIATLVKLELPSALPSMITGFRVAAGLSVIGAIVGEFVAGFSEGSAGLGITVLSAYRQLRTDLMFGAVLAASLLGLVLFAVVQGLGRALTRHRHRE